MVLALALLALAFMICLMTMYQAAPQPNPPAARSAPPDPISEQVAKWMHDWERGRA